jgi:phage protein D
MVTNQAPQVPQIAIKVNGGDLPAATMNNLFEAEVETTLDLPSMFVLRFYDDEMTLTMTDGNTFAVGATVQIDMTVGGSDNFVTVLKGEITAIEPEFTEDLQVLLTIRGYDRGHRLSRGAKTRTFLNSKDSDIVSKIASEAGLSAKVEATTEVHKHVFQDDQSDFAFLHERARRIGYELYVDDKTLNFQKPKTNRGEVALDWGVNLRSFRPRITLAQQVNKVTVKDWDLVTKKEVVGTASSSSVQPAIGLGKWGGQAAQSALSAAEHLEVRSSVASQSEATLVAQAILDEINANFIEAEGVAFGNPALLAGKYAKIGKVGTRFGGKYKVTSARHIYTPQGYDTYFTIEGMRPQQISDLVGERTKSSWGGVYPALVTNNNDPEKLSRVKLKFPWLSNDQESHWARIASVGAGASRGFHWLPEVNDEVLVAFERGDFNRPYVVGNLWNGKDAPPETVANAVKNGKVEVRTLKTREGHTIRLTDTSGGQKIEIIDCKGDTSIVMDTTNKKITVTSKGDIVMKSTGNMTLEATGNLELKGAQVSVQGKSKLDLQSSGMGSLKATGILEVKGSMVNIN